MEQLTTGRISLRRTGTYAGAPVAGFVTALHTGRRKVLVATGAYHGAAPWCTPTRTGTLQEDRAHLIHYTYNDIDSLDAAVADMDGDGSLDLALMGTFATRVVLQQPDGTFDVAWQERIPGGRDLAAGDADGDGDPDLYVARAVGKADQPDAILLNDGTGSRYTWLDTPATLRGGVAESVVAIDIDGDGTDEFLVLNGRKGPGRVQLISVRPR